MSSGAQNMKTRVDTHSTAENEFGSANHENGRLRPPHRQKHVMVRKKSKRDRTPSVPPKTSLSAQNMKSGPDALGTAENEYGDAKHENGPDTLCTAENGPRSEIMKTGPDAVDTAENEFGRAKQENGSRRPRYRRKRVRERKT
jgi:hypothetical protein